ncbi:NUDIX domain-containing protein [Carboxylicivirga sp. M1479]|uniref:NUDIX hydrolase n=1 Tax=Carboxylicivirga sp. M1479 TaxID=2594476 RepID=UPI0011779167|nr:NUDIX domain-containing protein [Carboxylicivirga sp. M1479]TRX66326.1 NUDIX domain-containing protein [Carboxylicivirga sp. M1479]
MLKIIENKYQGLVVENASLPKEPNEVKLELELLLTTYRHKQLIWVPLFIEQSSLVPALTQLGFQFHHCDETSLMLVKKLQVDAMIPTSRNYIVGVGAIVLKDDRLLVIKDRFSPGFKLPGGHIDKDEMIKDAVKREVKEETGIDVEFESIRNLGHFRNGQFGESNLYIVCTAKALSETISIQDADEILEAKWMNVHKFLSLDEVNNYNKSVVKAYLENPDLKLIDQQVELRIKGGEVFF